MGETELLLAARPDIPFRLCPRGLQSDQSARAKHALQGDDDGRERICFGSGKLQGGTQVYLRCSSGGTNFFFKHCLKNGQVYGTSQNFYYTAQAANADFVAVFEFLPPSPNEPQTPPNIHRLYLQSSPEGACSFNRSSGERFEEDQYVSVTAYPGQNFDFQGWYRNGGQVSTAQGFNYLMPTEDVTLTARFVYNPVNPSEPESPGEPTTVRGDADGDGSVDVTDAVLLTNHYLAGTTSKMKRSAADVNQDGDVDVTDAVSIVNMYLGN